MGPRRPRLRPERATESQEYPNELVEDRDNGRPAWPVGACVASGGLRGQWRPAWPVEACVASGGPRGQWRLAWPVEAYVASGGLRGQ